MCRADLCVVVSALHALSLDASWLIRKQPLVHSGCGHGGILCKLLVVLQLCLELLVLQLFGGHGCTPLELGQASRIDEI